MNFGQRGKKGILIILYGNVHVSVRSDSHYSPKRASYTHEGHNWWFYIWSMP